MTLPAIAVLLLAQNPTKNWMDPKTDIKITYPSNWSLRKDKYLDELKFEISGKTVRVELTGIEMNYPPSHWQEVMREINTNNNRTVLRQWEEELLGVPMVKTRVRDTSKSEAEISVTGLLMSVRPQKFMYRLYSPEGVADEAERQWTAVLLTADSVSGKLPSEPLPVDPNASSNTTTAGNSGEPVKVQILKPQDGPPKKTVRGSVRSILDEQRGIFIYLPNDWSFASTQVKKGDLTVLLSHGLGDERAARSAWFSACGAALARLEKVTGRVEPEVKWFASGFKGTALERRGTSDGQDVVQWIAFGWRSGYYYTYTWTGTPESFKSAKDQLSELLALTAIAAE